jgi:hypothetical protein
MLLTVPAFYAMITLPYAGVSQMDNLGNMVKNSLALRPGIAQQ